MGKEFKNRKDMSENGRVKSLWKKLSKEKSKSTVQLFRITLDIDTNNKEFIKRVLEKIIKSCKFLSNFNVRHSAFKGFHIVLFCERKCDICRMVYDDFRRLAYDLNRPEYARDILFSEEIYPNCH